VLAQETVSCGWTRIIATMDGELIRINVWPLLEGLGDGSWWMPGDSSSEGEGPEGLGAGPGRRFGRRLAGGPMDEFMTAERKHWATV
jgi:hypothetical protein